MTLQQFYDKYIGKGVDFDGSYGNQCWDLVAQYAKEVIGCPDLPTGNGWASGVYTNFLKPLPDYFTRIKTSAIQDGDIIVWQDSGAGHIAIAYKGKIFNQNNAGRKYATLDNFYTTGLLGVLRPKKGVDMVTDTTQLSKMYKALLHRSRNASKKEGENVYLSKDSGWVFNDIYASPERAKVLKAEADAIAKYKADINNLKQENALLDGDKADLQKQISGLISEINEMEQELKDKEPMNFDDLSLGELLSEAFEKLFKIK